MKVQHRPQVRMTYPFTGEEIPIDKSLVPLIDLIWKAGIETTNSCIRHSMFKKPYTPRTWIAFRRSDDAEKFIRVITSQLSEGDDLLNRILWVDITENVKGGYDGFHESRYWKYELDHTGLMRHEYRGDIRFSISIFFPLADYDRVFKLFQKAMED